MQADRQTIRRQADIYLKFHTSDDEIIPSRHHYTYKSAISFPNRQQQHRYRVKSGATAVTHKSPITEFNLIHLKYHNSDNKIVQMRYDYLNKSVIGFSNRQPQHHKRNLSSLTWDFWWAGLLLENRLFLYLATGRPRTECYHKIHQHLLKYLWFGLDCTGCPLRRLGMSFGCLLLLPVLASWFLPVRACIFSSFSLIYIN